MTVETMARQMRELIQVVHDLNKQADDLQTRNSYLLLEIQKLQREIKSIEELIETY